MNRPTQEQIQEIRNLNSKRSPGNWLAVECNEELPLPAGVPIAVQKETMPWVRHGTICQIVAQGEGVYSSDMTAANAHFIGKAPEFITLLLAEVDALKSQIDDINRHHWALFKEFAEKSDHNMCICCSVIFPKNGPSPHSKEKKE